MSVLIHNYKTKAKKSKIFDQCHDYNSLFRSIKKLDNSNFGRYGELVTEAMIKHNRLFEGYEPNLLKDYGDDGYAYGFLWNKQLIQIKFKKKPNDIVPWGECAKAIATAQDNGIAPENVVFITNCKKPNTRAKKLGTKWILGNEVKKYIDNPSFIPQLKEWINNERPKEITSKKELTSVQKKLMNDLKEHTHGHKGIAMRVGKTPISLRYIESKVQGKNKSLTIWGTLNRPLAQQVANDIMIDRKLPFKILIVDSAKDIGLDGQLVDLVDGYTIDESIPHTEEQEEIDEFVKQSGHKIAIVCYNSSGKLDKDYIKSDITFGDEYQGLCGPKTPYKNHFINISKRSKEAKFLSGDAPWCRYYKTTKDTKAVEFRNANDADFGPALGKHYSVGDANRDGLSLEEKFILYECDIDFDDDTAINKFWKKKKHSFKIAGQQINIKTKAQKRTLLISELQKDAAEYIRKKYAPRYESVISYVPRVILSESLCDLTHPVNYSNAWPSANTNLFSVSAKDVGPKREEIFDNFRTQPNAVLSNVYICKVGTSFPNANIISLGRSVGSMGDLLQIKRHTGITEIDRANLKAGKISVKNKNPADWKKPYAFTIVLLPKGFWNSKGEKAMNKSLQTMIDHQLQLGPLQGTIQKLIKSEEKFPGTGTDDDGVIDISNIDGVDFVHSNLNHVKKYIKRMVTDTVRTRTPATQDSKKKDIGTNILREWRTFCDTGHNRQRPFTLAQPITGKLDWTRRMCKKYNIKYSKTALDMILNYDPSYVDSITKEIHNKWLKDRAIRLDPLKGENADFVREYISLLEKFPLMSLSSWNKLVIAVPKKDAKKYKASICRTQSYKGQYVSVKGDYFKSKYNLSDNLYARLTTLSREHMPEEYWSSKFTNKFKRSKNEKKYGKEKFCEICDPKLYKLLKETIIKNYEYRKKEITKVLKSFLKHLKSLQASCHEQKDLYSTVIKAHPDIFQPGKGGSNNRELLLDRINDPMANRYNKSLIQQINKEKHRLKNGWPTTVVNVLADFIGLYNKEFNGRNPVNNDFCKKGQMNRQHKVEKDGLEYQLIKKHGIGKHVLISIKQANTPGEFTNHLQTKKRQISRTAKKYLCTNKLVFKQYQQIHNNYRKDLKKELYQEKQKVQDQMEKINKRLKKLA